MSVCMRVCMCVWVPAHAALAGAGAARRWRGSLIGPAVIWPLQILNHLRERDKGLERSLFIILSLSLCVLHAVALFHLFTSRGQFVRIGCQHSEVIDYGLEVGDLSQHGDLSVLQNKKETRKIIFLWAYLFFSQSTVTCGALDIFLYIYNTSLLVYCDGWNRGGWHASTKKRHQGTVAGMCQNVIKFCYFPSSETRTVVP